jgi:hypothetical protein
VGKRDTGGGRSICTGSENPPITRGNRRMGIKEERVRPFRTRNPKDPDLLGTIKAKHRITSDDFTVLLGEATGLDRRTIAIVLREYARLVLWAILCGKNIHHAKLGTWKYYNGKKRQMIQFIPYPVIQSYVNKYLTKEIADKGNAAREN